MSGSAEPLAEAGFFDRVCRMLAFVIDEGNEPRPPEEHFHWLCIGGYGAYRLVFKEPAMVARGTPGIGTLIPPQRCSNSRCGR
jgi:hypothetical protein